MKGYLEIPQSMNCKPCKQCGAHPIVLLTNKGMYVVKCPTDDLHYQTQPGLIDVEDWNFKNGDLEFPLYDGLQGAAELPN